jgi:Uma2 family endonuclease
MDAPETALATLPAWVPRRKIDVDEYHRMGEAGILRREDRVELIEGELVVMSPAGSPHWGMVNRLTRMLMAAVGDRAIVSVQNPVRLDRRNEPEPDFALLRPRADDYMRAVAASPADVLLAIEVAASSLSYDRLVKVPLYARHGIVEFWIVDLDGRQVEIHREPSGERYLSRREVAVGAIEPATLPGATIDVTALFA